MSTQDKESAVADKIAEAAGPKSENLQCHGTVAVGTAGLTLSLHSQHLEDGKWTTNPPATITGPSQGGFFAQGRESTALGADGYVKYQTPDGALITMAFKVPYSQANQASIGCDGLTTCGGYVYSVTPVPGSGSVIKPVYTVNKK
jgi:hypothetical protein